MLKIAKKFFDSKFSVDDENAEEAMEGTKMDLKEFYPTLPKDMLELTIEVAAESIKAKREGMLVEEEPTETMNKKSK